MKTALYVGSFDPFTLGHENIVHQASLLFDQLILGVADNIHKKQLFTSLERKNMIPYDGEIVIISGLVADFVKERGVTCLVRGLRNPFEMDQELALAKINKDLCGAPTIYLFSDAPYRDIHSKFVQELLYFKKDISAYVPKKTALAIAGLQ